MTTTIYALRTTANREDQVMEFVTSNAQKKKLEVYSVIRPHGMRGYIFVEAASKTDAEQAAYNQTPEHHHAHNFFHYCISL